MKPELNTLSIYGSHDAGAVYIDKTGQIKVLEYERFVKRRYAMFTSANDHRVGLGSNDAERRAFLEYIKGDVRDSSIINNLLYNEISPSDIDLINEYFPLEFKAKMGHHEAHASGGFLMSGLKKALIFSVDGGGMDQGQVGYTKVFSGSDKKIELVCDIPADFGGAYGQIGCPISEIRPGPDDNQHSLSYAGKVMGICAYGKVRKEWVAPMSKYYDDHHSLQTLGSEIELDLSFNALSGQNSYDLAATSQYVFEWGMFKLVKHFLAKPYTIDGIVLVGGCALNVLFNQALYEYLQKFHPTLKLYIPPNPNDCGLALGQFLQIHSNVPCDNITYNGFEVLDAVKLLNYVKQYNARAIGITEIAKMLKEGKIIGLVEGNSEIGPRALGNRSIICDPSFPDMKNILNAKVKFREWYRPFAPVCREEDKDTYFENAPVTPYMSHAPKVRKEYHTALASVTHADATSRLQTVTERQNFIFYYIQGAGAEAHFIPVD